MLIEFGVIAFDVLINGIDPAFNSRLVEYLLTEQVCNVGIEVVLVVLLILA